MKRFIFPFLIILGIFFYGSVFRGVLGNPQAPDVRKIEVAGSPFESSHERAPYAQLLSIVNFHRFDLNQELADMGAPDVGYSKGKFFSFFPVGLSAIILPLYMVGIFFNLGQIFAYATIVFFAIGSLLFIFLICRKIFSLPAWVSIFGAIIYGFATTSWGYSITIYQHALTTFFLLVCIYGAYKVKNNIGAGWFWGVVVWGSYAIAIFVDYPNALLFAPVMVYFVLSGVRYHKTDNNYVFSCKSVILVTSLVFIGISGLQGFYNYKVHGGPLVLSNAFARYERDKLDLIKKRLNDEENIGLSRDKLDLNKTFQEDRMPHGVGTLLFATDKGLFFFSPALLLALFGLGVLFKKYTYEGWVLVFVFLVNVIMYGSFGDPWGGWAYGPRYLIPSMALLAIISGIGVWQFRQYFWFKIVAFLLIMYSAAVALLGAVTSNVVPPRIESIPEHLPYYNYLLNYHLLKDGKLGSIIYNTWLSGHISGFGYFIILYCIVILIFFVLLFIAPRSVRE